ncbi:class I SAM-dependent methyltransferase [Kitasatospora sp. NBC_00240]|uniref:class I SAM-dependent methyltransferase n=1 Tax=Kitasatospora sp. NBC_00240 TaxID=2903567 RepID=UPI002257059A|nr:class I SAM-dependent methyltransferase [Kitasatospora sp. NBC_00240]MCX5214695.1 class I SAM-dependent methyltransferase [Kitasatospora sp. NBC_00240]
MTARRPASSDRVPSDRGPGGAPNDGGPENGVTGGAAPADAATASVAPDLAAVPETALWTLYHRAVEAARPDTVLPDPKAVELVDRIDYPFAERFGSSAVQAQLQALRVACFDREVADFLTRHPRGTVVCLGEGLETQFWRVDNGRASWLTVDLPESLALREKLLPPGPRQRYLAADATGLAWADEVDRSSGVLVTAQGLLMYLQPAQVRSLIAGCAEAFPGGTLVLDAVPRWFRRLTLSGKVRTHHGYQAPSMPWAMDAGERDKLRSASSAVMAVRDVWPVGGRGLLGALLPLALRVPPLATRRPSVTALEFVGRPGQS